ncbi:MAG: rhodanese-like domain-containing protein [Deltaproteobacteria bacterium]|nr:rhodanese-like domain-containing protein [Deltaproteobacteria bacterium]
MKNQIALMVVGIAVSLFAAGAPSAAEAAAAIDGATARSLAAAGAKVVDVRTPEEFASGHVPGAINIPYDEIGKRASEIGPPSTQVLLYCRTGRRSGIAADALDRAGYKKVYDFRTVTAWPGELAK